MKKHNKSALRNDVSENISSVEFAPGYLLPHLYAIFLAAQEDARIAERLSLRIRAQWPKEPHEGMENAREHIKITEGGRLLYPKSREDIEARIDWLLPMIAYGTGFSGERTAQRELFAWKYAYDAREYECPKVIVIGFILGVIPPVGAGNINKKKKLTDIVREDIVSSGGRMFADRLAEVNAGIIHTALLLSGGSAQRLEPDMHDWLSGERKHSLYAAPLRKLNEIERELTRLSIIHHTIRDERGIAAIAVSPALDAHYHQLRYEVELVPD